MISYTVLFYIVFNLKDFIKDNINKEEYITKDKTNNIINKIKEKILKYKFKFNKNINEIGEKNKIFEENLFNTRTNTRNNNTYYTNNTNTYNINNNNHNNDINNDINNNNHNNDINNDINNNNHNDTLVLYKNDKKEDVINKDININLLKNDITDNSKSSIILSETKNNIFLDENNNFIIYNFESNKNSYYRIKCNLTTNNIKNIKLIINGSKKKFLYDLLKENEYIDKIKEYSFILDYNNFNVNESIFIYLLFYDELMKNIKIDNINIEIIEHKIIKNNSTLNNSILIFNINEKYIPIYTNVKNILDFEEYSNKDNIFFI